MARPKLDLIPLTYPMPTGKPPVVDRLALFGAPSSAIGAVLCAFSTIDINGFWVSDGSGGVVPAVPPSGVKWWHVLVAVFPISPFAAVLGGLIGSAVWRALGEAPFNLTMSFAVVFALATIALTVYLFSRPKIPWSVGETMVVGTEGFEKGHYSQFGGGAPQRVTVRFDAQDHLWLLQAVMVVSGRGAGRASEDLTIIDLKTGAQLATLSRATQSPTPTNDPFEQEREAAFGHVLAGVTRVKVALAEAALRAGRPVVFRVLGEKPRTLALSSAALEDHHDGKVRKLPLSALQVTLEKGVYTFSANDGAPPILLERHRINEVFVLEALLRL